MKILSKEKSALIDRTVIMADYPHLGKPTPSGQEIKKSIAKELKVDENLVVVKDVATRYGEGNSIIKVLVYDNLDELKKLEKYTEPKAQEVEASE